MPIRRDQLLDWDVPIAASDWLSDAADAALYGLVEPTNGPWVPIYSYVRLAQLVGPEEASAAMCRPVGSRPWVLWPPNKAAFWKRVETKELVAWEFLTPAICGVGWRLPEGECVAYDRGLVIDLIMNLHRDSRPLPDTKRLKDAEKYFKSNLLEAKFGKANPIYVWRLPE
jgi:hypothetical protein